MHQFKFLKKSSLYFLLIYFASTTVFSQSAFFCTPGSNEQKLRSKEIHQLYLADQADRERWFDKTNEEMVEVTKNDMVRRKRIGEIFGEGCFSSASDYHDAAMIYQHGDVSDHAYQAFIWAQRAVTLGMPSAKDLAALTLDRYLIDIGHKQLFGSQAFCSQLTNNCFCMQEVETTFPDAFRQEYAGFSLQDKINWVKDLNKGKSCPQIICPMKLKASPAGTVPGFW